MEKTIKLSDGRDFPVVGLGTFRSTGDDSIIINAIKGAVKSGYRHFDCAWLYGNEHLIGRGLKEAIAESEGTLKREDFFIVGKIWNSFHSEDQVEVCLNKSLEDLQIDYIDLLLIHWPMGFKETGEAFPKDPEGKTIFSDISYIETYKALEKLQKLGKTKSIGVSNFNIQQLQDIFDNCETKPVNNQIELNPYLQNDELVEFCQKNGVVVSCYGPLGAREMLAGKTDIPILLENETLLKIALAHNKTPAQVCIRWGIQRNLVMLPKSVTPSRIKENFEVFDFSLTDEQMLEIKAVNKNLRVYAVESLKEHKYYPFK